MNSSSDSSGSQDEYDIDMNRLSWEFFSSDEEDGSLRTMYQSAIAKYNEFDTSTFHAFTEAYRELHAEVLARLLNCAEEIDRNGIFSSNEVLNDLSTTSLPYLSVSYYIANTIERTTIDPDISSIESRCEILMFSIRKYFEFLSLVEDYGFITDAGRKSALASSLPEGIKGKFNLSEIADMFNHSSRQKRLDHDRVVRRMQKKLNQQSRLLRSGMLGDEEILRKALILLVKYHVELAFGELRDSVSEVIMLSRVSRNLAVAPLQERNIPYIPAAKVQEHLDRLSVSTGPTFDEVRDERMKKEKNDKDSSQLDSTRINSPSLTGQSGRLVGPDGKIQQPFTILPPSLASTMSRDQIRRNAFGTGQKLPTISVDELVKKELANMVETKPKPALGVDEDADAIVDAETMKARLWDEYTESVAKGSGNTLNLG